MSKHSKWAKVKNYKGVVDAKRAAVFTKLARAITVAAREGGGDQNFNFKLRTAVDQALSGNMPKDNIDRAIKRGTGEGDGERIEEAVYEGYGPGGAAVLVVALTGNRNRTSSSLKHIFSVHGGNLAGAGAVLWMFDKKGVIRIAADKPLGDAAQLALIDAGADDISFEEGEAAVTGPAESLAKLRQAALDLGLKVIYAGLEWLPKETLQAAGEPAREKLEELFEALDDDEDVNAIYSNTDV